MFNVLLFRESPLSVVATARNDDPVHRLFASRTGPAHLVPAGLGEGVLSPLAQLTVINAQVERDDMYYFQV